MQHLEALKEAIEIAKFPSSIVRDKTLKLLEALDTDLVVGGFQSGEDFDGAYDELVDAINDLNEVDTPDEPDTSEESEDVVSKYEEELEDDLDVSDEANGAEAEAEDEESEDEEKELDIDVEGEEEIEVELEDDDESEYDDDEDDLDEEEDGLDDDAEDDAK